MLRKRNIISIILFWVILIVLYEMISIVFSVNDSPSQMNVQGFFMEQKDSLDVLMIGSSEVYSDYSPAIAWENYGYTSYDLSMGAAPTNLYKDMIKKGLERQNPKLIVISLNGYLHGSSDFENPVQLHRWIDNVPYIYGRKDSVDSLLKGQGKGQFYFNMAFSHVNWKRPISLAKNTLEKSIMTLNKQSYLKGFCTVSGSDKGTQMGELQNIDFDNGCEDALRELLVYLQAQNIEKVLFVRFPHQRKFENPEAIDKIGSIISEYGYDILNLNDKSKELGIDVPADYSDAEHLNINGMEKMTEYLGKYIINKYDVSSEKSTGDIVKWNKCVKKTKEMINSVREDMKSGTCRLYYEASIYWEPKIQK